MSNIALPDFPSVNVRLERVPVFADTTVFRSVSGMQQRVNWQSLPRYQYVMTARLREGVNIASGTYAGLSEIAAMLKHFEDHRGGWDSWYVSDPYSGTQVRVRFVEDAMRVVRLARGLWEVEATLETTQPGSTGPGAEQPLDGTGGLYS